MSLVTGKSCASLDKSAENILFQADVQFHDETHIREGCLFCALGSDNYRSLPDGIKDEDVFHYGISYEEACRLVSVDNKGENFNFHAVRLIAKQIKD
jgi:hypothetical protein